MWVGLWNNVCVVVPGYSERDLEVHGQNETVLNAGSDKNNAAVVGHLIKTHDKCDTY